MFSCQKCGSLVKRRRRAGMEKITCKACFVCTVCKADVRKFNTIFQFLQHHAECPRCGTADIGKTKGIDKIDKMTRNPLRHLLRMFGAPLYHCHYCRYQFYDYRPRHPKPVRPAAVSATARKSGESDQDE